MRGSTGPSAASAVAWLPLGFGSTCTDGEMRCRVLHLLWFLDLLGLTGVSVDLRLQRLDFFCSKTELSHPVMGEILSTWE